MKRVLFASLIFGAGFISVAHATDVGVSIQFSQPGVFGRVDIGQFPQPQVIVPQPVVIQAPPVGVPAPEPVYLWVPVEHRKHWERYCHQYNACGHPVYFVNHVWYREHVMAHNGHGEEHREEAAHREHWDDERGHHRGHDEDKHGRGHGHD